MYLSDKPTSPLCLVWTNPNGVYATVTVCAARAFGCPVRVLRNASTVIRDWWGDPLGKNISKVDEGKILPGRPVGQHCVKMYAVTLYVVLVYALLGIAVTYTI